MFLQLHDSYTSDEKKYTSGGYIGNTVVLPQQKLDQVYNTKNQIGVVLDQYSSGFPALGAGCSIQLPQDLYQSSGKAWVEQIKSVQALYKKIDKEVQTKKKPAFGPQMNGPELAIIVNVIVKFLPEIVAGIMALITGFTETMINNLATSYYNNNKYDMQNICGMTLPLIESQIAKIDSDIASNAELAEKKSRWSRGPENRNIAVLSKLRLIYEKRYNELGGGSARGGMNVGLIAAAIGALSLLK